MGLISRVSSRTYRNNYHPNQPCLKRLFSSVTENLNGTLKIYFAGGSMLTSQLKVLKKLLPVEKQLKKEAGNLIVLLLANLNELTERWILFSKSQTCPIFPYKKRGG